MQYKTVFISGATDGIGKKTALELARMGARVIVHGRNKLRGIDTVEDIIKSTGNKDVSFEQADLSSLSQINKLARRLNESIDRLDVLINNAGVFVRDHTFTSMGIETTFAVNHLAHFALSIQLLPLLLKAEQGRVVTVSSVAHSSSPKINFTDLQEINSYMDYSAYSLSKLANVLFSNELAEKLNNTNITSNSLHPGVISTKLLYEGFGISGSSIEEGCKTSLYLAGDPSLSNVSGKYFSDSKETHASPATYDPQTRKNLWLLSEELCDIRFDDFV